MDLSPEMMRALLGNAAYDDQQKMLETQIAHARAMSMQRAERHTTGAGAAAGGMGDIINAKSAHDKEQDAMAQQRALQQAYIDALRQAAAPQQQQFQPQPDPTQGIPPMLQRPEGQ